MIRLSADVVCACGWRSEGFDSIDKAMAVRAVHDATCHGIDRNWRPLTGDKGFDPDKFQLWNTGEANAYDCLCGSITRHNPCHNCGREYRSTVEVKEH